MLFNYKSDVFRNIIGIEVYICFLSRHMLFLSRTENIFRYNMYMYIIAENIYPMNVVHNLAW